MCRILVVQVVCLATNWWAFVLSYLSGSKAFLLVGLSNPDTMTVTALEAVASLSSKDE